MKVSGYMKNSFFNMHPLVSFVFFFCVILFAVFIMNPVCLIISLICSFANALYINGRKTLKSAFMFALPMVIMIILINPAFNHAGVTIITYLPSGNPLTLESIIYAIASSFMLSSVIFWFSSFNNVMTSDKFVYLFGRIIPATGQLLSMSLRFVPRFTNQFKSVRAAQKCIGRDVLDGALHTRIKNAVKIVSIMITWSMENAIHTADSMKGRGYSLKHKTSFSIYKFEKRDLFFIILIIMLSLFVVFASITGSLHFGYFPVIKGNLFSFTSVLAYFCYFALMSMPLIFSLWEDNKWKQLRSQI